MQWPIDIEPNGWTIDQPDDTYGLGGWAFYEDLPTAAVWMAYSEVVCVVEVVL